MTAAQLRKVLDKFNNEDALVWVEVSGTLFPLCGKVRASTFTYHKLDELGVWDGEKRAEPALVLKPCECDPNEEEKIGLIDELPKN